MQFFRGEVIGNAPKLHLFRVTFNQLDTNHERSIEIVSPTARSKGFLIVFRVICLFISPFIFFTSPVRFVSDFLRQLYLFARFSYCASFRSPLVFKASFFYALSIFKSVYLKSHSVQFSVLKSSSHSSPSHILGVINVSTFSVSLRLYSFFVYCLFILIC